MAATDDPSLFSLIGILIVAFAVMGLATWILYPDMVYESYECECEDGPDDVSGGGETWYAALDRGAGHESGHGSVSTSGTDQMDASSRVEIDSVMTDESESMRDAAETDESVVDATTDRDQPDTSAGSARGPPVDRGPPAHAAENPPDWGPPAHAGDGPPDDRGPPATTDRGPPNDREQTPVRS